MKLLLGTAAYNRHIQQIALALHEADLLGAYLTGAVDHYRNAWAQRARRLVERRLPRLDRQLRRRRIQTIPDELIHPSWRWELPRSLAAGMGLDPRIPDWFWERGERSLGRQIASRLEEPSVSGFFGVEHGALEGLEEARRVGKPNILAFLSPHHKTRKRWVDSEYQRFPALLTAADRRILALGRRRDERRDREARLADLIHCGSNFTRESLIRAGIPNEKIYVAPMGCPDPIEVEDLPPFPPPRVQFLFAGPASVRKGAHHLLVAWQRVRPSSAAELHIYGSPALPRALFDPLRTAVKFHGSVPQAELLERMRHGSALVFPTLCDGFGQVVAEALSQGLPVITTPNAGAADLIRQGANGFLVPPGDPEALAERLEWCVSNPRALHDMRPAALETARAHSWAVFRSRVRREVLRLLDCSADPAKSRRDREPEAWTEEAAPS